MCGGVGSQLDLAVGSDPQFQVASDAGFGFETVVEEVDRWFRGVEHDRFGAHPFRDESSEFFEGHSWVVAQELFGAAAE